MSWADFFFAMGIITIFVISMVFLIASIAGAFSQRDFAPAVPAAAPAVVRPAPILVQPEVVPAAPVAVPVAAVEWPKLEVQWGESFRADYGSDKIPFWGKYGEGFYSGHLPSSSNPEQNAYCFKILPGFAGKEGISCAVAASRDATNKDIVFVALRVTDIRATIPAMRAGHYQQVTNDMIMVMPYLFLSTDGEKTWTAINLPMETASGMVAVELNGTTISLFARDRGVADKFFPATIEID